MRVFYAVLFNQETKNYIESMSNAIQAITLKGRFVEKNNYHITLKFIGEVNKGDLPKLKKILDISTKTIEPFKITLNGLGSFSRDNSIIPWIDIDTSQDIKAINQHIERHFNDSIRQYKPHITIARNVTLKQPMESIPFAKHETIINQLALMESTHIKGKLVYVPSYTVEL